jgi:seryl-tRNA synthetase
MNEMLTEKQLPVKFVAMSSCFRREAGAAGKDTYGLYRIHHSIRSNRSLLAKTTNRKASSIIRKSSAIPKPCPAALGLPYRVVNVCSGDLGRGQVQKFDIETWMPSRKSYGETHSAAVSMNSSTPPELEI